ncbi:superinfection exclusion B family protein [Gilvimarinus chinensis]|uniref:superinfection exclusion B family protein n=1 Tax=Gilvimarinus chinensis TaxID=396005 RepID=UPI00037EC2B3|nr:superinfection exclusion B family protein [Gilvimarinus chinensis]
MKSIEKWADRVYSEDDFGRGIATSLSGIIGLSVYLLSDDWVISAFSAIIAFPIFRIIASSFNEKHKRKSQRKIDEENAKYSFDKLSEEELNVVKSFVEAGGSVLTWRQVNNLPIPSAAIESLIQRELIWSSVMADGMTETFALDTNIFNLGVDKYAKKNS